MADLPPHIHHTIWIDASPADVFAYFTDAAKLVRWMGAAAELDPSPNGTYRVLFKEGWVSRGQFLLIEHPHRLVYTVGWEGHAQFPPGSTRVELTFTSERGGTRVHLRHFGPPPSGLEADGWAMYLDRLIAVAEARSPGSDPFESLVKDSPSAEG